MPNSDSFQKAYNSRRRYDRPVITLLPMTLCPVCMGSGFQEEDVRCTNCFYPSFPGYLPLQLTEQQERIARGAEYHGSAKKILPDRGRGGSAAVPARKRAS